MFLFHTLSEKPYYIMLFNLEVKTIDFHWFLRNEISFVSTRDWVVLWIIERGLPITIAEMGRERDDRGMWMGFIQYRRVIMRILLMPAGCRPAFHFQSLSVVVLSYGLPESMSELVEWFTDFWQEFEQKLTSSSDCYLVYFSLRLHLKFKPSEVLKHS